ncbi:MAG TPA: ACT domain-containing protein, partial [Gemmatimonadaceae bacterium]
LRPEASMRDCSIQLTNHPGDLARVAQALARRGVNIKALAAISVGGTAVARILPDDIVVARSAFEAAGIRFTESEVNTVLLENKAGLLASVTSRLGEAGINLEALYVTGIADDLVELAIISDNPKKAKKILEEF